MVEMVYFREYFPILQNNYQFLRSIFGHMFSVHFIDSVNKKNYINSLKILKTSTHDFHGDICQFFYQDLFHIANTAYVQNLT